MSVMQEELVEEQVESRKTRFRLRASSLVLSSLVLMAFALSGVTLYGTHTANCQSRNSTLAVLRNLLVSSDHNYQTSKFHTLQEKVAHAAFIAKQLVDVDNARC